MSTEDRLVLDYMAMLRHLNIDLRLRLIAELTESIHVDQSTNKRNDHEWKDLFGAWSNIDDSVEEQIKRG
jgi:hypothetical protein